MALILAANVWTEQPQEAVDADCASALGASLAHAWALNVAGTTRVRDSADRAHGVFGSGTGSLSGNSWRIGQAGAYINFDNSGTGTAASTELAIGDSAGSAGPSGNVFSLAATVRLASASSTQTIYAGQTGAVSLRVDSTGHLELLKAGTASIGVSTGTLTAGVLYDIGASYNGTTATFYINGLASGAASSAQTFTFSQYYFGGNTSEQVDNGFQLHRFFIWNRVLGASEFQAVRDNPWQIFQPAARRMVGISATVGAHTSTGALAADSASVAGPAAHLTLHASTGALSAQAAVVAGSAAHSALHASSGALAADAATVAGSAAHLVLHTSSGALVAGDAAVAGSAAHSIPGGVHAASGALAADAATVAGSAAHLTLHTSSGVLAASDAAVSGSAVHLTTHAASGALVAGAATISGAAANGSADVVVYSLGNQLMQVPEVVDEDQGIMDIITALAAVGAFE